MIRFPEPGLQPPEYPAAPLRCARCLRRVSQALELPGGPVCRRCLTDRTLDELSALLCAPVVAEETTSNSGGTP